MRRGLRLNSRGMDWTGATMRQGQDFVIEADNTDAFSAQMAGLNLGPGSTGRIELYSPRILGVCVDPLALRFWGFPPVQTPVYLKRELEAQGLVVTDWGTFNGIGNICDAFVEFYVPVSVAQGNARMSIGIFAIGVIITAILVAAGILVYALKGLFHQLGIGNGGNGDGPPKDTFFGGLKTVILVVAVVVGIVAVSGVAKDVSSIIRDRTSR